MPLTTSHGAQLPAPAIKYPRLMRNTQTGAVYLVAKSPEKESEYCGTVVHFDPDGIEQPTVLPAEALGRQVVILNMPVLKDYNRSVSMQNSD